MKQFWFDGIGSAQLGLHVTGSATYGAPERDMEMISIPGRNGDLIIDKGRYKNIPVSYPVSIPRNFPERAEEVRAWLLSRPGYRRLEDDYDPEHFRLAAYKGPLGLEAGVLNRTGEGTISFDCKPQRFLKAGAMPVTFYGAGMLRNPTLFPAKPLISVSGAGEGVLTVGKVTVEVLELDGTIILDCESMAIYAMGDSGALEDKSYGVVAAAFPELQCGDVAISFDGGIEEVEIIPRWWTL